MRLTTEHLLNTLDGMDLLDLGTPGEWDGDLDSHDTYTPEISNPITAGDPSAYVRVSVR